MRKFLLLMLGMLAISLHLFAQNRTVTGRITDQTGAGVANASIIAKGTTTGTTTGSDGSFTLSIPSGTTALTISSIGFQEQEILLSSSATYTVRLASTGTDMNEVVVVAYGTTRREALTGSVGQIKQQQITQRPLNNITGVIEGAIPGVVTGSANGQPGSGVAIRVRGFGSINASSDPLFVVDGVPYVGGTSNLNPADVESITVLKDAASSALYGSRAANGVVIITTKKGQKGRNNVSVRMLQGTAQRGLPEYDRIDAFQYYPMLWEAYRNSLVYPSTGAAISIDSANRVASGLTTRTGIAGLLSYNPFNVAANTIVGTNGQINPNASLLYADDLDWTKDLLRTGVRKDYSVNLNGGAEKSDYYLSLGYVKENGYTIRTDFERFSARLNVNVQPKTWLKSGLNIAGNYTTSLFANDDGSTNFVNPFFFSRNVGPIYPVYAHNMTTGAYVLDQNGQRIWDLGNFGTSPIGTANGIPNRPSGGFAGRHTLAETSLNEQLFRRTVASARHYVDISFLRNFKFTSNLSVDFQTQNNSTYENTLVGDGAPAGRSRRQSGSSTSFIASQLLNYNAKFGNHRVDVLVGHESYNEMNTDINGFKQGQSLTGNTELGNFTTINSLTSVLDRYRIESYFSRLNYDYQGKYFISGSLRRDGNSRFAENSRWGTFYSVGGGWNIDKENFMSKVSFLNVLKLRGSYGEVGVADGIGFYAYQGLYSFANNANEPGIVQNQTAVLNKELTWEVNKQFDIGIDYALFNNRISGSVEYYSRISSDLLFAVPQPLSSGFLSATQNTATMYNRGIETQLSADIIRSRDFRWNTTINLSTVTNKITKMPATAKEIIDGTKKFAENQSRYDYWLRTYYGVDPADGAALYIANDKSLAANRRILTNKDGGFDTVTTNIANGQFAYQGGAIPDFYGSISQSFTYKGFSITALFTYQKGGKTYDALYQSLMAAGNYGGALHPDILKRWQKPGDVTDVPRMDAGAQRGTDHNGTSSRWLIDASYFNIRNVTLSYSLPQSMLSRANFSSAQVFLSGENLAFFSKRKGMNNQQAFSGVTSNAYPPARIITAGITLNF